MNIDWSILHWIQQNMRCGVLDFLMPKITFLGNSGILWIIITLILFALPKYRKTACILAAGLISYLLLGNCFMKPFFGRSRPCWLDPNVTLLIKSPTDYSFPSGHSACSAVSAVILTLSIRKYGWVSIPAALLIAFSRLYLYVHFPTDVLGGLLLGTVLGLLVYNIGNFLMDKYSPISN